jgi:hypothetical protein
MVVLSFVQKKRNESVAAKADKLNQAIVDETTTGLEFKNYLFNDQWYRFDSWVDDDIIVDAVINLFHRAFQKGLHFDCLRLAECRGRMDEILHAASSFDMFDKIWLDYNSDDLADDGFWSISEAMKFNKRLIKLDLYDTVLTQQSAAASGAGLISILPAARIISRNFAWKVWRLPMAESWSLHPG